MSERSVVRIGVIADTHGLFDPALIEHFAGVTAILHAGDIGDPDVIRQLEQIAPVFAVSGNVDDFEQSGFPRVRLVRRAGVTIAIRHILFERGRLTDEAREWLDSTQPHICIFGHSHHPIIEQHGRTILLNPGSAGPRRFSLPRGVGLLTIYEGRITPQLIRLKDSVGSGTTKHLKSRSKKGAAT
ncbi:MAG: metallophosphoesterase family protein [Nitrospira sp.]|nr:metallophosphoesterase family protein [Nitrospira sp.]